ncbi:MAG: hypothetical protein AAFY22_04455 [Pseudomonadota bacterium]
MTIGLRRTASGRIGRILSLAVLSASMSLVLAASPARAASAVFSGDGAGAIPFFETAETAAAFYGANNTPPFSVPTDGLTFFFHRDTTTDIVSLGLTVDSVNDGTRGTLRGSITGLPAAAVVTRADDNPSEFSITSPGTAQFNFRFFNCCTDGGVISGIDPENFAFNIAIDSATGLTGTYIAGPGGITSLGVAPGGGVKFAVAASPEPDAWALFILGFLGAAGAMKKQRRIREVASPKPLTEARTPLAGARQF